jgi:hypothetical protein
MFSPRSRFWLVVCLLLSNLTVGGLGLYVLHSVNQRYAALFAHSVPVVNNLRMLTRELSQVQRLARRIVDPANEPAWQELIPQMDDVSKKARGRALDVSGAELFRDTPHAAGIAALGREYDDRVEKYLALARERKLPEANQFNNEVLRPTYDNFLLKLDEAADFVEAQGNTLRDRYTQDTHFFGRLLLALAGWPLVAAGLALLILGALIAVLLVTIFAPDLSGKKAGPRAGA